MKLATKTALTAALFSLAVITGAAHAAPMGGIPGGDFQSIGVGNPPFQNNSAGQWSYHFSPAAGNSAAGAVVVNDPAPNRAARLTIIADNAAVAAQTWFTANSANRTTTTEAWEISADLKLTYNSGSGGNRRFRIQANNHAESFLFQIRFNDNDITWSAPGISGSTASLGNLVGDAYQSVSISYDPISGRVRGTFAGNVLFDDYTDTELTVGNVLFQNLSETGETTTRVLFVDNVTATTSMIPEPASMALLGAGSLLMLARRRRQTA